MDVRLAAMWLLDAVWPGDGHHTGRLHEVFGSERAADALAIYYGEEGHEDTSGFQPAQNNAVSLICRALDGDPEAETRVIELGEEVFRLKSAGAAIFYWDEELRITNALRPNY